MRRLALVLLGCVAVLEGCGDSAVGGDVADTGQPDTGPSTVPIVERASSDLYACHESLAPTQPAVRNWAAVASVVIGGETWALQSGDQKLYFGQIGTDATLGTRYPLPTTAWSVSTGAALADGTVAAIVWAEYDDAGGQRLRHATVDVGQGVRTAPHDLGSATTIGRIGLARQGAVAGLVWAEGDASGGGVVRYARLGADGIEGAPVTVVSGGDPLGLGPAIVARGTGFAVGWTLPNAADPSVYELWLRSIDTSGAPTGEAIRVSPESVGGHSFGVGWNQGASPMLVVGADLWLAYTESWSSGGFTDPEGATDIHLAVVGPDGSVARHPLNRSVNNKNATQASLFAFGSVVGVSWTAGTAIYICGGCFVDYDLHVLLVDPATMAPAAAPVVHTHNDHGYSRPSTTVLGSEIQTIAWQDFHALGYPAVAVTTCTGP